MVPCDLQVYAKNPIFGVQVDLEGGQQDLSAYKMSDQ